MVLGLGLVYGFGSGFGSWFLVIIGSIWTDSGNLSTIFRSVGCRPRFPPRRDNELVSVGKTEEEFGE